MAKTAGMGVAALAAAIISAPIGLADPEIPVPPAPPDTVNQASAPPAPVPHLSSPENLPPGTADDPVGPPESPRTTYLREIWYAVQGQDITWKDGLLLLTQRPMDPNSTPPPGVPAGPQEPGPAETPPPPLTP